MRDTSNATAMQLVGVVFKYDKYIVLSSLEQHIGCNTMYLYTRLRTIHAIKNIGQLKIEEKW